MTEENTATNPSSDRFALAFNLHQQGKLAEAEAMYQDVLRMEPSHFDATHMRGIIALQTANYAAAFALLKTAIQLQPSSEAAHINLALVLKQYDKDDLALQCLNRAITLNPENPTAWNNRGNLIQDSKKFDEALLCFDKAIAHSPQYAEAHNNRGNLLLKMRRFDEALDSFNAAIELSPELTTAFYGRGLTQQELGQPHQAQTSLETVITLNPRHADAHFHIGMLHHQRRNFETALAAYDTALALNPDIDYLFGYRLYAKNALCDWRDRDSDIQRLIQGIRAGKKIAPPFVYLSLLDSPDIQREAAKIIAAELADQPRNDQPAPAAENPSKNNTLSETPRTRIRIGYLSGDLRLHAVGLLTAELFELHNRSLFEVYGFCWSKEDGSPLRERIVKAFDHHIRIGHLSDKQAAEAISACEIDVLIDLQGFTDGARPNILLQRPANATQISYLGMPGTTGLPSIDYIVGDPFVFPRELEPYMSERPLRVPRCFQVSDSQRNTGTVLSRESCGLPKDKFVFAAFNNSYKITPEVFKCWMRILGQVPHSVLWLMADNKLAQKNLENEAIAAGIDPARIIFTERTQPAEYMARLVLPDLFLDTFPYNAGTTANDILWMGTPILTRAGKSFASRMCGSLLMAAGLPDLITDSVEAYEQKAVQLGHDLTAINQYKRHLSDSTLDLFNTPRLVKDLENAILEAVKKP